jgi:hypothetical protein
MMLVRKRAGRAMTSLINETLLSCVIEDPGYGLDRHRRARG